MKITARLDGRVLLTTMTLLIPQESQCELDLALDTEYAGPGGNLPLTIQFKDNVGAQSVSFEPHEGRSLMTLFNWNKGLASALQQPYQLAQITGRGCVDMMMANTRIGTANYLTLQFWWRAQK